MIPTRLILLNFLTVAVSGALGLSAMAQTATLNEKRSTFQAGVQVETARERGVVGLDLKILPRAYPMVAAVLPATPASRLGLKPGDLILAIDGQDTYGLSKQAVDDAISDRPGDRVRLVIARGSQILPNLSLTVATLSQLPNNSRAYFNLSP